MVKGFSSSIHDLGVYYWRLFVGTAVGDMNQKLNDPTLPLPFLLLLCNFDYHVGEAVVLQTREFLFSFLSSVVWRSDRGK